jgi:hypothetical protein
LISFKLFYVKSTRSCSSEQAPEPKPHEQVTIVFEINQKLVIVISMVRPALMVDDDAASVDVRHSTRRIKWSDGLTKVVQISRCCCC